MIDPTDCSASMPTASDAHLELLDRLDGEPVHDPAIPEFLVARPGTGLDRRLLQQADAIAELIGTVARADWRLIGLRAGATAHRQDHPSAGRTDCTIVHLLDRSGVSTTRIVTPDGEPLVLGPDRIIREGRIPDTCRRVFGLPTAPPPDDMTDFVLDAWLTLVLRAALIDPGLQWSDIVRLNISSNLAAPTGPAATTGPAISGRVSVDLERLAPARLAEATLASARTLDWHRYRHACIALGGCPVSDLSADSISWMDAGMFARWAQNSLPTADELLELLEPTLSGQAFDRLWATVSLCRDTTAHRPPA